MSAAETQRLHSHCQRHRFVIVLKSNISCSFLLLLLFSLLCATNALQLPQTNEIEFNSLDGAIQKLQPTSSATTLMSFSTLPADTSYSNAQKSAYTELKGGEIVSERTLRLSESPFLAREHIEVSENGKLIIEPGVTIEFAPTVGITVRGVLHAVGTPTARITLTSQGQMPATNFQLPDAEERGLRLVDGPTPLEGRLQIFHKGSWRSVCTNSRNWTLADYGVACKQLGYAGGRFWNWVERLSGYQPRLLYELPNCRGSENSLFECAWQTRQLGSGSCDYHNDIGIQCRATFEHAIAHWRGLFFDNAPSSKILEKDNTIYTARSHSTLKYVDIIRAGSGVNYAVKSAVESLGLPPVLEHVIISHAAYTGLNVTKPTGGFAVHNVTIRKSNGIGLFVNSSQGHALLEGCNIVDNVADGIKYVSHDLRSNERYDRANIYDFCTLPTTSGQTYPITLSFTQKYYAGSAKECAKYFFTRPGYLLTVHFEYFVLEHNETCSINIYDGSSESDRLLFAWQARNYTRPQSVTSTREKLFISIKGNMREELNGFIRLTSGPTVDYELRVVDSTIEDNGGRGVAIDNMRSKLHVHGSTISGNGHISGVHVTSGAGDVNITSSNISFNNGDGVNITYYGGNRNISRSIIGANKGYGIAVWLNETTDANRMEYIPFNQTTVLEYTQLNANLEQGLLHGNYCAPHWVNITGNSFNGSLGNDVQIESCWRYTANAEPNLQLQIGHNFFEYSQQNSIYLGPALNLNARIEYNQFRFGAYGCIYIRNDFERVLVFQQFSFYPVRI